MSHAHHVPCAPRTLCPPVPHGHRVPSPAAGGPPALSPGSTHVEDGEEHQDGDLEHADLHRDAVPDLEAGEEGQIRGCQGGALGEKIPNHRTHPSSGTMFFGWLSLLEEKLTQNLTLWHQGKVMGLGQGTGTTPKLILGAIISPQAQIVLQGELDAIDNLWQLGHHCQHGDTDEILQGRGDISMGLTTPKPWPTAQGISASFPHCFWGSSCSQGRSPSLESTSWSLWTRRAAHL